MAIQRTSPNSEDNNHTGADNTQDSEDNNGDSVDIMKLRGHYVRFRGNRWIAQTQLAVHPPNGHLATK